MRKFAVLSCFVIFFTLLYSCTGPSRIFTVSTQDGAVPEKNNSGISSETENNNNTVSEIDGSGNNPDLEPSMGTELEPSTPAISIYEPSLKKEKFLIFQNDQQGNVPVIAQAGAVENFEAGDQIAVSAEIFVAELACKALSPHSPLLPLREKVAAGRMRGGLSGITDILIPTAHAQTTNTCTDDFTYCPIADDGSYKCFVNQGVSTEKLYFTVVDSACNPATAVVVEDSVQGNVFYNAGAQTDTKVVGDSVYTVANGKAVKLAYNDTDERWGVAGNYDVGYRAFDANGTKLAYGDNDALIGVLNPDGVQLFDVTGDVVTNTGETGCMANDLRKPVLMKSLNGVIYCGMGETVAVNDAYLEAATTEEKMLYAKDGHKKIKIIAPEDGLQLVKVLGFDSREIDGVPWTVVAFSDGKDVRFRAIEDDGHFGKAKWISDVWKESAQVSIKEISFYQGQQNDSDYSKFAILDSKSNKVWFGKANINSGAFVLDKNDYVAVGKSPQSMQFSETSGNLYVLNREDKNISVIPLKSDTATAIDKPAVKKTINIAESVPGKTINFAPNSFAIKNKNLFVADETTKALILVDITEQETQLPDPPEPEEPVFSDNDQDGFNSDVDCNDNDATINPDAVEICGDGIDQNCDDVDTACSRGGR
ncbi:MAG: putative metal-binding motif-containing protein [Deltaproteobacteria bacterium]|nr:putative metal-binding motif-containing protein [Deltaproteobacteria bacterium]